MDLVGGHLALDLVNTVSWRLDAHRRIDRLADPAHLRSWLTATNLGTAGPDTEAELRQCRETAYAVLQPLALHEEPRNTDLADLHNLFAEALSTAKLVSPRPLTWQADTVTDRVRLAIWRLFEDEDLGRLRQCDDDACGWLFLDRSKNGSRRWCSSADCGNRARARRHYRRHQTGAAT